MKRLLCLFTLILTSLSTALATPGAQAVLAGNQVAWTASTTTSAGVLALKAMGDGASVVFSLQAREVEAEWVESDAYVVVPGATFWAVDPRTRAEPLQDVRLESDQRREGWFVFVFPEGDLMVEFPCGGVAIGSADAETTAPNMVDGQRPPSIAMTSQAVQTGLCDSTTLRGDMLVVLWQVDAAGVADGQPRNIQTGRFAGEPAAAPAVYRARQAFLHVHDGTLTVRGDGQLYLSAIDFSDTPAFQVHGAQGQLPAAGGLRDLAGASVRLTGSMDARLQRGEAGLSLTVLDGARSAEIDGTRIALATTGGGEAAAAWAWLLALPVVAASVVALRRRRLAARLRTLSTEYEALDESVLKARVAVSACLVCLKLGREDAALVWFRNAYVQDPETLGSALANRKIRTLIDWTGYA